LETQNWALSAYSLALTGLSKSTSEAEAFAATCQAIIANENYRLAWIGLAEHDPARSIRVATAAGSATSYLDDIKVSWDENGPHGSGHRDRPFARARSAKFATAALRHHFAPWRARAEQFEIHSSISIPFAMEHDKAALMVYSGQVDAFTPVAVQVFERLAERLSFTIQSMRVQRPPAQ